MSKLMALVALRGVGVWVGVIYPTLLFSVFSLTASSDILTKNPELAARCHSMLQLMATWFPEVDFLRHAQSTRFPEVATLTTAYACAWWLWMTPAIAVLSMSDPTKFRAIDHGGRKGLLLATFVGPPLGLFCFWCFFALPGDPSTHAGLTTDSRIGYGFMGTLAVFMASAPIGLLPVNLISLFTDVIFTSDKQQPKNLR